MNKSDLLNLAIALYKGVLTVYPKTSSQYLQIRQYITATFGHEGTRAMQVADSEGIQVQPSKRATTTTMRVFSHPIAKAKNLPVSNAVPVPVPEGEGELIDGEEGEGIEGSYPFTDKEHEEHAGEKRFRLSDELPSKVPGELEPQSLPLESPAEQQDVAAVKTESKPLEFSDLSGLRASAAMERFGVEPLKSLLVQSGYQLTGEESAKQIAGIACKLANPK
jgi:hypothetical protein